MARSGRAGRRAEQGTQAQRQAQPGRLRRRRAVPLAVAGIGGSAVLAVVLWRSSAPRSTSLDGDARAAAALLAGVTPDQISPSTRGIHIVYHSLGSVPSAATPRTDGKVTLLMLAATWCTTCRMMSSFVAPTVAKHSARLGLIEKDIDREQALVRKFRVFGTPTFVVLDPLGNELGRLPPDNDPQRWGQRLLQVAGL